MVIGGYLEGGGGGGVKEACLRIYWGYCFKGD